MKKSDAAKLIDVIQSLVSDPGSGGRLSEALTEYVNTGFLTREGEAYVLAPGVKVSEKVLEVA